MSTIRIARRRRYTNIDRRSIRDDRLSFRALGLLTWLLDHPDDWRANAEEIAREHPEGKREGRDAIRTAFQHLREAGYLVRERVQDPSTGRWMTVSTLYEHPSDAVAPDDGKAVVGPTTGNPTVGNPAVGKPGVIENPVSEPGNEATDRRLQPRADGQLGSDDDHRQGSERTAQLLARADLDDLPSHKRAEVRDEGAWLQTAARRRRARNGADIYRALDDGADPSAAAWAILTAERAVRAAPPPTDPLAGAQAAQNALMERNRWVAERVARGETCPACADTGWALDLDDPDRVVPCAHDGSIPVSEPSEEAARSTPLQARLDRVRVRQP